MTESKRIAQYALMAALVAVATFVIKIPTVATDGYLNLGDAILLYAGIVFGPLAGLIAGGIGSALADVVAGYPHWALPTFLIKGAEGALAGAIFLLLRKSNLNRFINATIASLPAALIMVVGYFFASWIMKGNAAVAWTSVPENAVQGGIGVALCLSLLLSTARIKKFSSLIGENNFYDKKESPHPKEK